MLIFQRVINHIYTFIVFSHTQAELLEPTREWILYPTSKELNGRDYLIDAEWRWGAAKINFVIYTLMRG